MSVSPMPPPEATRFVCQCLHARWVVGLFGLQMRWIAAAHVDVIECRSWTSLLGVQESARDLEDSVDNRIAA